MNINEGKYYFTIFLRNSIIYDQFGTVYFPKVIYEKYIMQYDKEIFSLFYCY